MYINLEMRIQDTGVGISEEGLQNLFLNFSKLKENQDRNKQGTGLGLSICKQIIEQMGGSVTVQSELGKGTTFIINIKTKCITKETILRDQIKEQENIEFLREDPETNQIESIIKERKQFIKTKSKQNINKQASGVRELKVHQVTLTNKLK